MARQVEIIDENGNVHGPFGSIDEALAAAAERGLGEERDADDEDGCGWTMQTVAASIGTLR